MMPTDRHFDIARLPFPAGRSRTARAYTTSARLPRCKIRARHDRHRTSTLDPLLRDPRRPDHGGAAARAHGAMAEVRRRLRDAGARCARAVRPRRTRTIEIGFGNGDNLLALAAAHPARDFLGVEVHRPGVGRLLLGLEERRLANVRVICHDAVEVFERQIAPQSVHEILILFPDPWPKKRHHKRRLIQRPFAELAVSRLTHGGVLRLATDWQPYALEMLATLMATPGLENLAAKALSCRGRRNARPRASSGAASASA